MSATKEDLESVVVPNFINEPIKSIKWGEWKPAGPEEEIIEIQVNGKNYLLLEAADGAPSGKPVNRTDDFWTKDDIKTAGYSLDNALKSSKPVKLELWESEYAFRLEDTAESLLDYYLFAK